MAKRNPVQPVTPHPKFGEGIKRLNKNPMVIFTLVALLVCSVFIQTLYQKTHHQHNIPTPKQKLPHSEGAPFGIFNHVQLKEKSSPQAATHISSKTQISPHVAPAHLNYSHLLWRQYLQQYQQLQQQRQQRLLQALHASVQANHGQIHNWQAPTKTIQQPTTTDTDYLNLYRTGARNLFEIKEGTVLPATLMGDINSDTPSLVRAIICENIFDSATGKYVLIPQGTMAIGHQQRTSLSGRKAMQITFERLIFPDQSSVDLDHMQAIEQGGTGGLHDKINRHWGTILSGATVSTFFELLQSPTTLLSGSGHLPMNGNTSIGEQIGESGNNIGHQSQNVRPTITIRAGHLFNITVSKDMVLPPYQDIWGKRQHIIWSGYVPFLQFSLPSHQLMALHAKHCSVCQAFREMEQHL